MLRHLSLSLVVLSSLVGALALPASAAATESTQQCTTMIDGLADKQAVLDELQAAIEKGEADRQVLAERSFALAVEIAGAEADGRSAVALKAERAKVDAELARQRMLAPAVQAQADALADEIATAERAYITCVDATL